jgi:hypothetical protein
MGLTDIKQPQNGNAVSLAAAINGHLKDLEKAVANKSKMQETYNLAKHTLEEFQTCCKKTYLKDVTKDAVMEYSAWVQKVENKWQFRADGWNKFMRVAKFLRANGLNLVTLKDALKYDEGPVEAYEAGGIKILCGMQFDTENHVHDVPSLRSPHAGVDVLLLAGHLRRFPARPAARMRTLNSRLRRITNARFPFLPTC